MKKSRILAGLVSAVSAASLMASMTANAAVLVPEKADSSYTAGTEWYENVEKHEVESLNEYYGESSASYIERYGTGNVSAQYLCNGIPQTNTHIVQKVIGFSDDKVAIGLDVDISEVDAIAAELTEKFCNDEETSGIAKIYYSYHAAAGGYTVPIMCAFAPDPEFYMKGFIVEFKDKNHEINIARSLELADYVFDNYTVDGIGANFADTRYFESSINWTSFRKGASAGYRMLNASDIAEIGSSLKDNGFDVEFVSFTEPQKEDIIYYLLKGTDKLTESDLYKLGIFLKNNFDIIPQVQAGTSHGEFSAYKIIRDENEETILSANDMKILAPEAETLLGDANCDGKVDISDAVLILQYLANPEKYPITAQGLINADIVGNDGITALDALQIQMMEAGSVS